VRGGGEPGHVQAYLRDDGPGQVFADAGDLGQPGHGGQHRGVRSGACVRAGGPVAVDPPGGGHRRGEPGGPGGQRRDPLVQEADVVQQHPGELAVVVIEHAVHASASSSRLALMLVRARLASTWGSRCPAIIALIMSCAEMVVSLLATDETARQKPAQCHLRPLRSPSLLRNHFEGSRGGRLASRRHAVLRLTSHTSTDYPIHHFCGREPCDPIPNIPNSLLCPSMTRRTTPRSMERALPPHTGRPGR
jgi:hypothetical protein